MSAVNSADLAKFIGILEVRPAGTSDAFTRIASVRGLIANYDTAQNLVEVKADDTGTVFKGYLPEARIEGEFLEVFNVDLMELLFEGSRSDVAGSLVAGATQVIASPFIADKFYPITNQNGDGTSPTINSVTGATDGAFTAHDDHQIVQNEDGVWGIVFNTVAGGSHITTLSQAVTINYDYTPNASESLTLPITFQEAVNLEIRVTVTEGSDIRRVSISEGTFEGAYGMSFLDIVEAGDITGASFVFKGNKNANLVIYDEILS